MKRFEASDSAPTLSTLLAEKGLWALVFLTALLFHRPLLLGEIFFFRDLQLIFLPQKQILSEMLRAGEWPWWNVYLHGGVPFLADIQTSGFYPTTWLHGLFSSSAVLTFELVSHTAAAAVAAYLLARRLGSTPAAAFLTGGLYAFCGYTLSKLNIFFHLLAVPYLPLLLLCWHSYLRDGHRRWFLAAVLCATLQVLTGAPEAIVMTLLFALGWGLFRTGGRRSWWRQGIRWGFLGSAMAGLAAIQLVPMLELVLESARGSGLHPDVVSFWSLDPRRLPELIVPGFLGDPLSVDAADYWGAAIVDRGKPFMLSLYFGMLPIALALAGGFLPGRASASPGSLLADRRLRAFLTACFLLGIVLALGRFLPFYELLLRVPGIQFFRYPIKFLNLSVLPVALLAGTAFDHLFTKVGSNRVAIRPLLAGSWGIAMLTGLTAVTWVLSESFRDGFLELFFEHPSPTAATVLTQQLAWIAGTSLLAALLVTVMRRQPRAGYGWTLATVLILDLLRAGQTLNPSTDPEILTTVPPAAQRTLAHLGEGRFFREDEFPQAAVYAPSSDAIWLARWNLEILTSSLAIHYGIPTIFHADLETLAPGRLMKMKGAAESVEWPRRIPLLSAAAVRVFMTSRELDLPGVEPLATIDIGGGSLMRLYRNSNATDRATFVTTYYRASSADDAMGAMLAQGFDPRRHAVVEGPAPAPSPCQGQATIERLVRGPTRHELAIQVPCSGLLVLSELHYPGWKISVDGRSADLLRANVAFSAVWLEAGEHSVEWRYVPRIFLLGASVSLFTALALVLWGTRRSHPGAGESAVD